MAKLSTKSSARIAYVCGECGAEYSKWQGQCGECSAWNTLSQIVLEPDEALTARVVADTLAELEEERSGVAHLL